MIISSFSTAAAGAGIVFFFPTFARVRTIVLLLLSSHPPLQVGEEQQLLLFSLFSSSAVLSNFNISVCGLRRRIFGRVSRERAWLGKCTREKKEGSWWSKRGIFMTTFKTLESPSEVNPLETLLLFLSLNKSKRAFFLSLFLRRQCLFWPRSVFSSPAVAKCLLSPELDENLTLQNLHFLQSKARNSLLIFRRGK